MEQNTKEWLEWRARGIGASDAPAIMGVSEYKTKRQLWNEKYYKEVKEDDKENTFIQDKGHRLEAVARAELEFEKKIDFRPALFTHEQYPIFRASLDGWNEPARHAWEHKYIGKDLFMKAQDQSLHLLERIPAKYLPQIAHQYFVSNASMLTLSLSCDSLHDDKRIEKYHLDVPLIPELKEYIEKTYLPEALAFWKSVQEGIEPEPEPEDKLEINDNELIGFLEEYGLADSQKKKFDTKIKNLRKKIEPKISHTRMIYDRFSITKVKGKESVDYKAAFEAFCGWVCQMKKEAGPQDIIAAVQNFPDKPSLVKYTNAGKESIKITIAKPKKSDKKEESLKVLDEKVIEAGEKAIEQIKAEVVDGENGEKTVVFDKPLKEAPKASVKTDDVDPRLAEWKNMSPEQQTIQAEINRFKNPITGKAPRLWAKKSRPEQAKYLRKQAESDKATGEDAKVLLELAEKCEKLEKEIAK